MSKAVFILMTGVFMLTLVTGCSQNPRDTRMELSLNGIWDFYPNGDSERYDIRVPSFWDAPQDYDYPAEWLHMMHGIYKTSFEVPESMAGMKIMLSLDRISVIAKVLVNGRHVGGEQPGGYLMMMLPYQIDVTDIVKIGEENTLEVMVWGGQQETYGKGIPTYWTEKDFPEDALEDGQMFYPWCVDQYDGRRGINGDVSILAYPEIYIDHVFVMPHLKGNENPDDDAVSIETRIVNESAETQTIQLSHHIQQVKGRGSKSFEAQQIQLAPGEARTVTLEKDSWPDAEYWWSHNPQLYLLKTEITSGNDVIDHQNTRFGFREFTVNGNTYELNGKRINLRAESFEFIWHEGYSHGPSAGPVFSTKELTADVQKELVKAYKSLNLNAMRMHKAGVIEATYDFCDEIGMLVIDEVPFFQTQNRTDARAKDNFSNWVRRWVVNRRNHPSIIMWSICNECWTSPIPGFTYSAAKEMDPTRPAYHQGVFPNDFEGDAHCTHYAGGYPFETFNKENLYGLYKNRPDKPRGEGESFCPEGWPIKNPDGTVIHDRRSARGSNVDPDLVSQSQWIQGVCRYVRAMRFAELADARSYMNWVYCFDPVPADVRPEWKDLNASEIKPVVIHRPVCNTFDKAYPVIQEAHGIDYWRNTHAPVAVFDVKFDETNRLGAASPVFKDGQLISRELVIYNNESIDGEDVAVEWELGYLNPLNNNYTELKKGSFDIQVPYGEKRLYTVTETIPDTDVQARWLLWTLRSYKQGHLQFEEINRLGALGTVPAPLLTAVKNHIRIKNIESGSQSQLHKIILQNAGGGVSELWRAENAEAVKLPRSEGNCRGEEELYFYVDASDLKTGRYEEMLCFKGEHGSQTEVNVEFTVIE